ncbi:MAG: ATP-dependent helicase [Desulfobacteraceae bacterium]|nr:ATP-dependent helicase [Desulfobacteraceae bacterium]
MLKNDRLLDKLHHQGLKKVIIAVPEKSIGASFKSTTLSAYGFFTDWVPNPAYNLCLDSEHDNKSKVSAFKSFLDSDEPILICTHATLRFAFEECTDEQFNDTLLAIDEFHHVSADTGSILGECLRSIMANSNAHIIAMTGSYFRGDAVPILLPDDESRFEKVTYNYYEQLNGYSHLKSLGIGYHFYQGRYTDAILELLDTNKKTIIHIPNVNSGESTKDKHSEVGYIIDAIGKVDHQDPETGIIYVKRHSDGKVLKIADLVEEKDRSIIDATLSKISEPDDMDIIIALGKAKEGFDWPYCEHALTVGYRSSLTEIIQIIGRVTRDVKGKVHAQFTNLIAQPDAKDEHVQLSVNNMLKAVTASLLMEQVLAPNFKFRTKLTEDDLPKPGEIKIRGLKEPSSNRVKAILESDLNDLKATILQDDTMLKVMPGNVDPEVINKVLIPKIIQIKYPDLDELEIEQLRQYVVVDSVFKNGEIKESGDKRFIRMADQFINIDDLHIDLIDKINPFQKAFEILSKTLTSTVFRLIQETIDASRIKMDFEEAKILWPKIQEFIQRYNREPNVQSLDPQERRMAECVVYLKNEKRRRQNG